MQALQRHLVKGMGHLTWDVMMGLPELRRSNSQSASCVPSIFRQITTVPAVFCCNCCCCAGNVLVPEVRFTLLGTMKYIMHLVAAEQLSDPLWGFSVLSVAVLGSSTRSLVCRLPSHCKVFVVMHSSASTFGSTSWIGRWMQRRLE